ncbi:MAG: sterol desaturase family protein [Blastocatellia bacterium]|nr:sterol desaturase family protein [Blastocatellia bacterium]
MPQWIIQWLHHASWVAATTVFLAQNLLIFVLVLVVGNWMVGRYANRPVGFPPPPVTVSEFLLGLGNVGLNTLITLIGWQLWQKGVIRFREDMGLWALADIFVLLLVMDFLMYLLHRVAHLPWLFPLLHQLHHRYERLRPLTLFALNPFENLGFGTLWLTVVTLYPASWAGMSVYLMLNVAFGAVGHLGVEPVPAEMADRPILRWIAGSSFHAQHHQNRNHNFGFYTLIWDHLFKTLEPNYRRNYGQIPAQALPEKV